MRLSIAETAILLGKTDRQVRYAIRSGALPAERVGGRWFVKQDDLPISDGMQIARQAKARRAGKAAVRRTDGDAPIAGAAEKGTYSVRMLDAYEQGAPLYREMTVALGRDHAAVGHLRTALYALAAGCHAYDAADKAARYREARTEGSHAVMSLLLDEADGDAWVEQLEGRFLPRLGGLIRRAERRARRRDDA
ncbi:MAG: helix-turn-helix domain-containing protein [Acidobacteriota bacterium]